MNIRQLEEFGYNQATDDECAAMLNMELGAFRALMDAGGRAHYDRGKAQGLYALRKKMMDKAVRDGDSTMLGQLGRAYLSQESQDSFNIKEILKQIHENNKSMLTETPPGGEK